MSEPTPDRRTEGAGPRYQFLGTVEVDCLAGLPADAPERAWPVMDTFPKVEFLGTVEQDGLSGLPADAPERSWPVAEWGAEGYAPAGVPALVLTLTLRSGSDPQRTGNVIAHLLHALSRYEAVLGGRGLAFQRSESTSDNGTIILRLRPIEGHAAAERLARLSEFLHQCGTAGVAGPAAILDVVDANLSALAHDDPTELVKQSWMNATFAGRELRVLTN